MYGKVRAEQVNLKRPKFSKNLVITYLEAGKNQQREMEKN